LIDGFLRLYNVDSFHNRWIEHESFVNSIPIGDGQGKELVIDWVIEGLHNNKTLYTDSNGLELQQRIFNYRPTWNLTVE
jgi:lysosomal alpha-mannosidase